MGKECFIYCLFCLLCISCLENKQPVPKHKLTVEIEGIDYDSLFIYRFSPGDFSKLKIAGEKKGKGKWLFSIPDTVYNNLVDFEFVPQTFDYNKSTSYRMVFQQQVNGKLCNLQQLNFNDSLDFIFIKYKETVIHDSIFMSAPNGELVCGTYKQMFFSLKEPKKNLDFLLRMDDPYFSMFLAKDTIYPYRTFYDEYLDKVKRNPDSRYYISRLATQLKSYKTKEDIKRMYDCFSDRMKQSVFGQKIQKYLDELVSNELLENAKTGKQEYVIADSSRYTLILFSASWCQPCHKQLPLQKKLYARLKEKLDMVTVSIDEKNTVEKWRAFVKDKAIPWRTMFCRDVESIRNTYKVPAIPHCKLVYPGLKDMEVFDLWDENDVDKLCSTVSRE